MAGQPTKLNEQLIYDMCDKIRNGLPITYTCEYFGITIMSHSNWLRRGENDIAEGNEDTIYAQYFYLIKKAHAEFVEQSLNTIRLLPKNWQAIAWWLERTDRNFMPKQQIEANTEDGKVTVVLGGKVKELNKNNLLEDKSKDDNNKR